MKSYTAARLLSQIIKWRLAWNRDNTHRAITVPGNPKFMGPRDAVGLIHDGDVIAVSGLGSNQWVTILYYAIRELFEETGHPRDLTLVCIGGQGARGRAPGSLEELGRAGLCTRFFVGHAETFKSMLNLADAGKLELQCIPQGALAFLIDGQDRGIDSILTATGVGTVVDPRVGYGTVIAPSGAPQWVEVENNQLRFRLPKINVAMFNAPAADREGNIYVKNCAIIAETTEIVRAARRNGGTVIADVAQIVEKGYDKIFLPADAVDAVVVDENATQAGFVKHRQYWPMFTTKSDIPIEEGVARLRFINRILGYTPRRGNADDVLARLAASVFAQHASKGCMVNVGIGLPEEVCRLVFEAGLVNDVTFFSESGAIGGLPAPGVFFGAGVCPQKIISSVQTFKLCYERLDFTILGGLQADSHGNVNVSRRGKAIKNFIGPGGFIDLSVAAANIIFVCNWMVRAKIKIEGGRVKIVQQGKPKFIGQVDEITFSGQRALDMGKNVFYVTNIGVFKLTPRGMELFRVVPGVDIQNDIINACPMKIVLPESGHVPIVEPEIMTGAGFHLALKS